MASPEQLEGRDVTIQSDLCALGLVLYELFSDRPAFEDRTPEGVANRSESTPPSLSAALDSVDPSVTRIVDRCLPPRPEKTWRRASAGMPGK